MNAVATASPQNSPEYSTKGRSRRARPMTRVAVSMPREKIKRNKKTFNTENNHGREESPLTFGLGSGLLSHYVGAREQGEEEYF